MLQMCTNVPPTQNTPKVASNTTNIQGSLPNQILSYLISTTPLLLLHILKFPNFYI